MIETADAKLANVGSESTGAQQGSGMRADSHAVAIQNDLVVSQDPPVQAGSHAKLASVSSTSDPEQGGSRNASVASADLSDKCLGVSTCIDEYLWSIYERAPKLDTITVSESVKSTITEKGKTRTISKSVVKLIDEDFTWKDPNAAQRIGMPLKDYVIGGMDWSFKLKLYRALRAMDDAGLAPGITSAFRDDYRQSLASGKKAASDSSYHGGSRRGGYGHGLAADLVSVKGETRAERLIASHRLWRWIDQHGPEFGIARPYGDKDPPHVGPIDGQEYAEKRGHRLLDKTPMQTSKAALKARPEHIQTDRASSLGEAVVGHQQPRRSDISEMQQLSGRSKKMKELDQRLAKKLTAICRGC